MTIVTRVQALCNNGLDSCLAEFEGYTLTLHEGVLHWAGPDGKLLKRPPNFTGDLNIMAALEEKHLTTAALKQAFSVALSKFIPQPTGYSLSHASPKQHAQAFLVVAMRYLKYQEGKVPDENTED